MRTVDIKGKKYVEVSERVLYFRENYPDHALESTILSNENGVCVIKAVVRNPAGVVIASGHAYEQEGSSYINKTSYIENCETSAWGRALANLGIGIDAAIASAQEVVGAIAQRDGGPVETPKGLERAQKSTNLYQDLMTEILECTTIDEILDLGERIKGTKMEKQKADVIAKTWKSKKAELEEKERI